MISQPRQSSVPPFVNGGCQNGHCEPEWLSDFYGVEHGPSERKCRRCNRYIRPGTDQPMVGRDEEEAWVSWRRGERAKPMPEDFPYVA